MYNLVIVESPAKAKTIENYLGKDYKVISTVGHIRDLKIGGFNGYGIDIDNNYEPTYSYIKGKKKVVNDIKKKADKANKVFIATDPDREGEAIGWHVADELGLDLKDDNRVIFVEITKQGIESGMSNIRTLDMDLVKSQETRRKIDRIMGFSLSKLLQKKIKAKSAGRVQSVALKVIVEREDEIQQFVPVEYYKINALYGELELEWHKNGDKVNKEVAYEAYDKLKSPTLIVQDVQIKERNQKPKLAYITSTLQQDAVNRLGYSSKKTMSIAQKLYEGVEINGELMGLITYMRSDSYRLSSEFIGKTRSFIEDNYGANYKGNYFVKEAKGKTQDAHEAIRPSDVKMTPEYVKRYLTPDQYKLYELIWLRTVAAMMTPAKIETTKYEMIHDSKEVFQLVNSRVKFDGYKKIYKEEDEHIDVVFTKGQELAIDEFEINQNFTKPKPRYTEASLIKTLEENGVGRPSTYSAIIEILKVRKYVELDKKRFVPTELGILVSRKLEEHFSSIIDVGYTSNMEQQLDEIEEHKVNDITVIDDFYHKFLKLLEAADEKMEKMEPQKTGEICPDCGGSLVMRRGRYGEFEGCENFPTCKYITTKDEVILGTCPKCSEGQVIEKKTRRGKVFYACNKYPKCDYATWDQNEAKKEINERQKNN